MRSSDDAGEGTTRRHGSAIAQLAHCSSRGGRPVGAVAREGPTGLSFDREHRRALLRHFTQMNTHDAAVPKPRRRTLAEDALNVPNLLTMGRVVAIPFFVWLLNVPTPVRGFWACIVFTAAALSDVLDGYLARRLGVVSVLGKFLDPLADKLIVMAALVWLVPLGRVAPWVVVVLLGRENQRDWAS